MYFFYIFLTIILRIVQNKNLTKNYFFLNHISYLHNDLKQKKYKSNELTKTDIFKKMRNKKEENDRIFYTKNEKFEKIKENRWNKKKRNKCNSNKNALFMSLLDNYNEKSIKALILAREIAKIDKDKEIQIKHLITAITKMEHELFIEIFKNSKHSLSNFLEKLVKSEEQTDVKNDILDIENNENQNEIKFSPKCKLILKNAVLIVKEENKNSVGYVDIFKAYLLSESNEKIKDKEFLENLKSIINYMSNSKEKNYENENENNFYQTNIDKNNKINKDNDINKNNEINDEINKNNKIYNNDDDNDKNKNKEVFNIINNKNDIYNGNDNISRDHNENSYISNDSFSPINHERNIKTNISELFFKDCLVDLTKKAIEEGDKNFYGRKKEIKRIIEILGKKKKSNPILIGESGVGKSAIVEYLSYLIAIDEVPSHLKNFKILQLNINNIVSGTKYRGEFEEKMKNLLLYLNKKKKKILFIDEIHVIVGAGSGEGTLDAANILKPVLSSDNLQCIGITTFAEYEKFIAKDKALKRRFIPVIINPLSSKKTYFLLKKIKKTYENYHNIYYTNRALKSIITFSEDYLPMMNFPDKAIDILDEAGAYQKIKYENYLKKLQLQTKNEEQINNEKNIIKDNEQNIIENNKQIIIKDNEENIIKDNKQTIIKDNEENIKKDNKENIITDNKENIIKDNKQIIIKDNKQNIIKDNKQIIIKNNDENIIKDNKQAIIKDNEENITNIENNINEKTILNEKNNENKLKDIFNKIHMKYVTSDVIEDILSKKSSIKFIKRSKKRNNEIFNLKEKLNKAIIGQDKAIDLISKYFFKAITNVKHPDKPIGTILLCGSTGVGKTLCAKKLSEYFFNKNKLILINMGEYTESYSVSKLYGSFPGYVGYEEGGYLTEEVKKKPFSIILFDEIEKAHKSVLHVLLQIMEDGNITDSKGNNVSFKNTFIIMTSNIGADIISDYFKLYNKNYSNLGFKYYSKKMKKNEKKLDINDNNLNTNNNIENTKIEENDELEKKIFNNEWYNELQPEIEEELKKHFIPEFLNRIDEKIVFRQFLKKDVINILINMIEELKKRLKRRQNLNLIVHKNVIDYLSKDISIIYDMDFGARSIKRAVQKYIEDPISSFLLSNYYEYDDYLSLNLSENKDIYIELITNSIKNIK